MNKSHHRNMTAAILAGATFLAGCAGAPSAGDSGGSGGESAAETILEPASLKPDGLVGEGRNGEQPASVDELQLTDEEKAAVAAGDYTVGVVMQTMDIDWSKLQVDGITDTLEDLGVEVVGVTNAKFDVKQQISDIQNMITKKPDAIISIPVDDVATAEAYKQVAAAGIKLVFIHMPPVGLSYPDDYQSVIAPDNQGNGEIAAKALAEYIPEDGTAGIVDFGVDFYTTNQRTLRFKEWMEENRPDITLKEVSFTDTNNVGPVAANFVTANPGLDGLFAIWDSPAAQAISSLRAAGVKLPMTTIDLGNEVAVDLASNGYIKAIGAQQPYDQGVAEALAVAKVFAGEQPPPWVALPAYPVTAKNVLSAYEDIFKTPPPATVMDACDASGIC